MSYKDMRALAEMLKLLGYPRIISMDSFRLPNFELVADSLHWLVTRICPDCNVSDEISTEVERVRFLQATAQAMLTKARVKLNIRRLYAADGAAVKDLLKLATLLYRASQKTLILEDAQHELPDISSALKCVDVQAMQAGAGDIVHCGAALHDVLGAEPDLRMSRVRALAVQHDMELVQRTILEAASQAEDTVRQLNLTLNELSSSEAVLQARVDKRRSELERAEKRLATLAAVRPAYMDEYEALGAQLDVLYGHYLERFRNLEFLEANLEGYYCREQSRADAADRRLKKLQRRLADEELRILRGEAAVDETQALPVSGDDSDDDGESEQDQMATSTQRGRMASVEQHGQGLPPRQQHRHHHSGLGTGCTHEQHHQGSIIGSIVGASDDDGSIDEDTATDGGDISTHGSVTLAQIADNTGGRTSGQGITDNDDVRGDDSDDSGF